MYTDLGLTPSALATFDFVNAAGASMGRKMQTPDSATISKALADFRAVQDKALIIGGIAVIHYGLERSTKDIDALYFDWDEAGILKRLDEKFKRVNNATNGWHHFQHRETDVRLELIPEGGLTTYGFIPSPKAVGGVDGYISLSGLVWLKLVSRRPRDEADISDLALIRMSDVEACRVHIPTELHECFDAIIARTKQIIANDPNRPQ